MTSFISDVLNHLQERSVDFSNLTIILPSKRAGTILRNELSGIISQSTFSPHILSTENFVEELSQLKSLTQTELLFEFYSVYRSNTDKEELEPFDDFLKWAPTILQDFNEIDRYLIEPAYIFNYLTAIKDIDHWSLSPEQTPLTKAYLTFWKNLQHYYSELRSELIQKGLGYQGLIYREAVDNLENYIQSNQNSRHIFIGFNALNEAESRIIQELLHSDLAEIYWDTDEHFLSNEKHGAGYFIRHYLKSWRYLKTNPFHWSFNHYTSDKDIQIIGTPKSVGQAKYIGEILADLHKRDQKISATAVVLGDENLLMPVLNSIPKSIDKINVTMGFPLRAIPLASLFESLFLIHKDGKSAYYYKDIIEILSHQFIMPLFNNETVNDAELIIRDMQAHNMIFLTKDQLSELSPTHEALIYSLFNSWGDDPEQGLVQCKALIWKIKEHLDISKEEHLLGLESLFKFNEIFNLMVELNALYGHIDSIKNLFGLYKQILSTETLDFKGEPLEGLQLMGMLESRVLDFENVIIASANEGILPSGKSQNSFIPFDVKIENKLPTYREKDAVYTYHFYRLLHRAKNIFIIYDTEAEGLKSGEKSRFITQLEIEGVHKLNSFIVSPTVPKERLGPKVIKKTESVLKSIEGWCKKGVSPSALLSYIRNPIDFYAQRILGIDEHDDVEEIVAAHTLGTIIHESLRELYEPFVGAVLTPEIITSMRPKIDGLVKKQFKEKYKKGDLNKGKNLIIFEIAKRYVANFLDWETVSLRNGDTVELIAVERDVNTSIEIEALAFPINLRGQIDRIDKCNGVLRIIDYKSGHVLQNQVEIINWEDLTSDYKKYSKSFQILMYAFMLKDENEFQDPIEAGIISFKNLSSGFMKYAKKDKLGRGAVKDHQITQASLRSFSHELDKLILEIFNPEIDFVEKEV